MFQADQDMAEAAEKKKKRTFRKYTYRGVDLDQLLDMSRWAARCTLPPAPSSSLCSAPLHPPPFSLALPFRKYTYRGVDLDQLLDMSRWVALYSCLKAALLLFYLPPTHSPLWSSGRIRRKIPSGKSEFLLRVRESWGKCSGWVEPNFIPNF